MYGRLKTRNAILFIWERHYSSGSSYVMLLADTVYAIFTVFKKLD